MSNIEPIYKSITSEIFLDPTFKNSGGGGVVPDPVVSLPVAFGIAESSTDTEDPLEFRMNVNNDGTISLTTNGVIDSDPDGLNGSTWVTPTQSAPGTYEVQATSLGAIGGTQSGTFDTWLPLTSSRGFGIDVDSGEVGLIFITLSIRDNGGSVLSTQPYSLRAENES